MAAIGQELLNVPMGDMIRQMAFAIAEAQYKLDENSIDVAEMMGGLTTVIDEEGNVSFDDSRIFFGHEYMTKSEALSFAAIDDAVSGRIDDDTVKLVDIVSNIPGDPSDEIRVPTRISMLELGFTPTFYQFVDTIIEVKISIKITRTRESSYGIKNTEKVNTRSSNKKSGGIFGAIFGGKTSSGRKNTVTTSQVDATYSSKYSYSAEGSSLLRTKLSPIPPPPILEERIRSMMEEEDKRRNDAIPPPV